MEIQCCATCKCGYCESGECICMTDVDYMPHDVGQKNKRDDHVSINREAYTHKITFELRQELPSNRELYDAFVASTASALKEVPTGTGLYDVAKAVADRIIGIE